MRSDKVMQPKGKMMHTRGLVIDTDVNGYAHVILDRKNACSGCGSAKTNSCKSCLSGSKIETQVINSEGAVKGDLVSVSLSRDKVLRGAAALYLLPVVGLFAGSFTGVGLHELIGLNETAAALLFGFAGLSASFYFVRRISEYMNADGGLTPWISKIIHSQSEQTSYVRNKKEAPGRCAGCH